MTTHMALGDRAARAENLLVGRTIIVVTRCEDEYCYKCPHSRGSYTLLAQEAGEWLGLGEDDGLYWLPRDVRIAEPGPKWKPSAAPLPSLELYSPSPRSTALSIVEIVRPYTLDKVGASQPGYFWAYRLCDECTLLNVESSMRLDSITEIHQSPYALANLPKFRADNLMLALKTSRALCTCSSRG